MIWPEKGSTLRGDGGDENESFEGVGRSDAPLATTFAEDDVLPCPVAREELLLDEEDAKEDAEEDEDEVPLSKGSEREEEVDRMRDS